MQSSDAFAGVRRLTWFPALFLAIVAIAAAAESMRLGLGNSSRPGPGFFPFILSVMLALTALPVAAGAGRNLKAAPANWVLSLKAFTALCLYGALLVPVGFIAATLTFFALEVRIIERVSWRKAALQAAIATAAAYGLFALLGVQLPAGLWLE